VVLLDNTDNEDAGIYGEAHVYDGEKWVATEESDALAMTYKDALELAELSQKTIYASEIYASLIVTKRLRVQSGNFLAKINETDGVDVTYGGKKLFNVEPLTGLIYFGEHFWYNPSDGAIHTPDDNTLIRADGTTELLGTLRTGYNAPTDARVAIQDESGITSGPTFTGSGLNDLTITNAGYVAGDFRVKISGINNATDSGKEGYWATPFKVGTTAWYGIAVNSAGRFVAVGDYGGITYSDDGITWATPFAVGTTNWRGIAVNSAGRFVAVGAYGYISYSDDGITWETPFQVGTRYWYAVAVNSSGRFVAVGDYGNVSYSNDGITWVTPFQVGTSFWYGIAVNSSGRFVAGGEYGDISYSDDGITWATPFRVGITNWRGIAVNSAGRFVAGGNSGYVSYSDDGITWATPFAVGTTNWRGIAVNSAGRFVAVGAYGYISYSDDGITWATPFQVYTVGTSYWYGIAVNSSGRFVAVDEYGYITMSLLQDTIQISSNGGTTWGSNTLIPLNGSIPITGFGIDILFGHAEGHTVGDYWSFEQGAMRGLAITDSAGHEYFSASNGVVTLKTVNADTVNTDLVNTDAINLGTSSLSASGYATLPNGMVIQWVSLSLGSDVTSLYVTFPIAFSSACVFATVISSWHTNTAGGWDYVRNISTTGCTCVTQAGNPRLLAIGY
jgi:hypothetical protein